MVVLLVVVVVVVVVTRGRGEEAGPPRSSNGHGTGDDLVFQHDADHQEDEIQHEHDEAEQFAHAPLAGGDGDDDEEEHDEEEHDCTEEAVGADFHWLQAVDKGPHEPGERQSANTHKHMLQSFGKCAMTCLPYIICTSFQ